MTLATLQGLADCLQHVAPLAEHDEEESARLEHYVNVVQQWVHDLSDSSCLERFVHSGGGYELTHLLKVVMLADLTANCCRLREVVAETLQILLPASLAQHVVAQLQGPRVLPSASLSETDADAEVTAIVALRDALQALVATPVAVGSGRVSAVHKLHALLQSLRLFTESWEQAARFFRGAFWSTDLGTEAYIWHLLPMESVPLVG